MVHFKIPTVLTADELTDLAFKRAGKIAKPTGAKTKLAAEKAFALSKLQSVQNTLGDKLNGYVESFPSIDNLHPFYSQLIDVLIGVDRLKKSLGAINWAKRKVEGVCSINSRKIKSLDKPDEINSFRSSAYGRVTSVLKQVDKDLLLLNNARETLRKLPEIDPEVPTVVIAGFPNVGKSMLVERLSTAKPEVASYPFTTKRILMGHFEHEHIKFQVIDTPGLLDSDPEQKKNIERQAVMALEHLATIIVFVLDPSEYCGYPIDSQLSLMERLKAAFPSIHMIEVENKADLKRIKSDRLKISAQKSEGIDELMKLIITDLQKD